MICVHKLITFHLVPNSTQWFGGAFWLSITLFRQAYLFEGIDSEAQRTREVKMVSLSSLSPRLLNAIFVVQIPHIVQVSSIERFVETKGVYCHQFGFHHIFRPYYRVSRALRPWYAYLAFYVRWHTTYRRTLIFGDYAFFCETLCISDPTNLIHN